MAETCDFTPDLTHVVEPRQIDPNQLGCVRMLEALYEKFGEEVLFDDHTQDAYRSALSPKSQRSDRLFECQTDGCEETYVQTPIVRRGFVAQKR